MKVDRRAGQASKTRNVDETLPHTVLYSQFKDPESVAHFNKDSSLSASSLSLATPLAMTSILKKALGLNAEGNPSNAPPLHGLRVLEFAGLAPGPLVGLILADFGADVIRIDKVGATMNADGLARGKRSIAVDPKTREGLETLRRLMEKADVVIDPFRPGVLERLGLGPEEASRGNEGLVFARLTGFQRQGELPSSAIFHHELTDRTRQARTPAWPGTT